ncbi:MAG: cytochrome c maturation protein CcmE [Rhodospirillales bacterium]|nr:cytochrome c maturation protein CcmE [Rhodospirillales bacterium]
MKPKHRRLTFVVIGLGLLGIAAALILSAFQESIVFFHSPSELAKHANLAERRLRIGGLVEEGSVNRSGATVTFRVTDLANAVTVAYTGILPDLFREGQGVVAEGRMKDGVFVADQVLAKHDENYMPPEVADSLKKSGQWQHMRQSMEQAGQIPQGAAR